MKKQVRTLDEFINQIPKNRQMENYTEKLKTEILNESKSKLVERFREYLEGLGFNPMNVWSNEFGLFAQLKEYLKKVDNFTQIYGSEPKMGTIVRLSYNDIGNEKIVGDFVFEQNVSEKSYADIISTISDEDYQKLLSSKEYKKAYNDYLDGDKKPTLREREAAKRWALQTAYSGLFENNNENELNEKFAWAKYLKELGINSKKFKKEYPNEFAYFKEAYLKSSEASEFEQNHYDDLLRITGGLTESLDKNGRIKKV